MINNFDNHSANERTFLAWVRTAIAVVGLGLAAGRLSDRHESLVTELGLLAGGALVIALAYARMIMLRKLIDAPDAEPDSSNPADLVLILLIGGMFMLMALFALNVS